MEPNVSFSAQRKKNLLISAGVWFYLNQFNLPKFAGPPFESVLLFNNITLDITSIRLSTGMVLEVG